MPRLFGLLILVALSAGAQASQEPFAIDTAKFAEQRSLIQAGFADGERYSEIKTEDREQVLAALGRIQERLGTVSAVNQLNEQDRVAVFNDQELINTVLTRAAADSRLVCKREASVGSHKKSNNCATVAERRRRSERARQDLDDVSRRTQSVSSGE